MKKRICAWLLVLCLALSLGTPAANAIEDWKVWSQSDRRWGELSISSTGLEQYTMAAEGCLITAMAKMLIYSGQQSPNFTPADSLAAMLEYDLLTPTGALTAGYRMNTEGFLAAYGPELEYFTGNAHAPWDHRTAYNNISQLLAQNCFVIIKARNNYSGSSHFMTVEGTADGHIYVMDNLQIVDLYASGKYSGVTDWLCFRYSGSRPYPGPVGDPLPPLDAELPSSPLLNNFSQVAQYTDGTFFDVEPDSWFRDGVARAYELGLVEGEGNGGFGVQSSFTVGAALTLAARMHAIYHTGNGEFARTTPWYAAYVNYALAQGIISPGQFSDYTRPATKAELAVIFSAALPDAALAAINTIPDGSIPDVPMDAPYARATYRLYRAGILTGDVGTGAYRPDDNIRRVEAACLAARVADLTLRQSVNLGW